MVCLKSGGWLVLALALASQALPATAAEPEAIDFNRSIRPLLSNLCFKCHGPDHEQRKGGLRLDVAEDALHELPSGERAIVPGKPEESELIRRIFSEDENERMPPADSPKQLTQAEKELIRDWVAQGAEYREHWSFRPIRRPELPMVKNTSWPRNPLDYFILARLEAEGLQPAPEADRITLLRRVTLDLTGLPPTPADVEAFLADKSPDAYEKLVDRLLSTPQYAERMTLDWLDASRFADTNGYHIDNGRNMTAWRDWVIQAFADNMPYDQFTVEQLAGDLLPEATLSQQIASGFNRNHMINFEGGAIPEEYHTAYIIDRVNTTGTVFLGLSVGCAQCHDHKFDPISQEEFYQLYAFFYNVPENGLDGYKGNSMPFVKVPTLEQKQQLQTLQTSLKSMEQRLVADNPALDQEQAEWEQSAAKDRPLVWQPLVVQEKQAAGGGELKPTDDGALQVSGANPDRETYTVTVQTDLPTVTGLRLELLPVDGLAGKGPGRSSNGNIVLTDVRVSAIQAADQPQRLAIASATADFSQETFPISQAIDKNPQSGWAIYPETGKPHTAVFQLEQPIKGAGPVKLQVVLDFQSQFSQHQPAKFRLSATDARNPHSTEQMPENIRQILALDASARSADQQQALRTYYRSQISTEGQGWQRRIADLKKEIAAVDQVLPTAMVMSEMASPRDTRILIRGQYDKKGEKVTPGVPKALPGLPAEAPQNRLGLAQWLVSSQHPLMSRVTVNRYWQLVFGTGLVKTAEDFGSQGELPSHPVLLDWLASEFMQPLETKGAGRWDVKALMRMFVTSATYRQASAVTPDLLEVDPENRLLARGPRYRLPIEFIRDQALSVSGLLDRRIGGASVSPYQPAGLWEELMSRADGKNWTAQEYAQSHGADLYRRTMYTFWKRTCPPPSLTTFDAPDRETCTVRRARTNTPLQALVLLNDPTYVEASRKLAERILKEAGPDAKLDDRLALAVRLVLTRPAKPQEIAVLKQIYEKQLARFRAQPEEAGKLLEVGEAPRDAELSVPELAAWSMISSVLLNLDEAVTKG